MVTACGVLHDGHGRDSAAQDATALDGVTPVPLSARQVAAVCAARATTSAIKAAFLFIGWDPRWTSFISSFTVATQTSFPPETRDYGPLWPRYLCRGPKACRSSCRHCCPSAFHPIADIGRCKHQRRLSGSPITPPNGDNARAKQTLKPAVPTRSRGSCVAALGAAFPLRCKRSSNNRKQLCTSRELMTEN